MQVTQHPSLCAELTRNGILFRSVKHRCITYVGLSSTTLVSNQIAPGRIFQSRAQHTEYERTNSSFGERRAHAMLATLTDESGSVRDAANPKVAPNQGPLRIAGDSQMHCAKRFNNQQPCLRHTDKESMSPRDMTKQ